MVQPVPHLPGTTIVVSNLEILLVLVNNFFALSFEFPERTVFDVYTQHTQLGQCVCVHTQVLFIAVLYSCQIVNCKNWLLYISASIAQ
jgi:hypothetical protein